MKYLLTLGLLFSVAWAQTLPQQYQQLSPEKRQQYDAVAQKVKPKLDPIEQAVRALALNPQASVLSRLEKLSAVQTQLNAWIGESLVKYTVMLPLLNTVQAQRQALAEAMPLKVPYKDHQIKAQFNISGAQPYALGEGNVTLVRGEAVRGDFTRGEKVMVYFKQGGPVLTSIREEVSSPGDSTQVFLLAEDISVERFLGNAAMFIPQS